MGDATTPAPRDGCPLCGLPASTRVADGDPASIRSLTCERCGEYRIEPDDAVALAAARTDGTGPFDPATLHLVSAYTREVTIRGGAPLRVNPDTARAMIAAAPHGVPGRADRFLLNLAGLTGFAGERVHLDYAKDHVLSYSVHGGESAFLMEHLIDEGLVDREPGVYSTVAVSVKGWGRVEALRSPGAQHRQGFVAMSFDPELLAVYDAAIAPAIREAGYDPFVIAEHEHTGQIDDTIFLELNRSRFVVADFTGHRPNVYFEAGYALGRGLPVIWTCRQDEIEHAHFDTRQYNHLLWTTPDELQVRLRRRIQVVVG